VRRLVLLLPLLAACSAPPTPADDDDDDATDPVDGGWDWGAPDVPDGTRLLGVLTCSLYVGPTEKSWQKQGEVWNEIPGQPGNITPGLEPCLAVGDHTLTWDADGAITFIAGGWEHRLAPTEIEERWFGETEPAEEPGDGCLETLAESALELPLQLVFDRTDLIEPGS